MESEQIEKNFLHILSNVPQKYSQQKFMRDGNSYHLTVVFSNETVKISPNQIIPTNQMKFDILGLGVNTDCYYLVCVSSELDNYRKSLGLDSKDFHITLGFNQSDKHDISKGIETIKLELTNLETKINENLSNDFDKNIKILTKLNNLYPDNFLTIKNLINELCKTSNYQKAYMLSIGLIESHPESIQSYYMYLMLSIKTESIDLEMIKNIYSKLLDLKNITKVKICFDICKMINYIFLKFNQIITYSDNFEIITYEPDEKIFVRALFVGLEDIHQLYSFGKVYEDKYFINPTENQKTILKNYLDEFVFELNLHLISTNSNPNKNIKVFIKEETNLLTKNQYILTELPGNFSIVKPNLYGSAIISSRHIDILSKLKINTIINLIGEEKPKDEIVQKCINAQIKLHHIGFRDRTACDFETYLKIQEIIKNPSNITLIHCVGGIGRTNMILSGYLMELESIPPSEAISILKSSRKVIMVPEQIMFLKKYYGYLINGTEQIKTKLPTELRGLIIMMGLPCSGKSTLALEIYSKYSSFNNNIIHINQDEIGKSACEELLSSQAKTADLIILDRCNPTDTDRTHWIKMYKGLSSNKVTIIFLNLGLELSLKRLPERKNHLTLGSV
jgi:protein-tyrosine phosphatase